MKVALFQFESEWLEPKKNLDKLGEWLGRLESDVDIVVLPELFTTGFCVDRLDLAEPLDGATVSILRQYAQRYDIALVGSFLAVEGGKYYNEAFFVTPEYTFFEPKRHLFARGGEKQYFTSGDSRMIIEYMGVKFCVLVCYDLRFPVWSRNTSGYDYDVLIYVAAWPQERIRWWDNLLMARSIENQCIVCGVNAVGVDGNGLHYPGHSTIIDTRLQHLVEFSDDEEGIRVAELDIAALRHFREKCPMYLEADKFRFE